MLVTRHGALFATRQFGSREDATAFPSANTKRIFPLEFYLPTLLLVESLNEFLLQSTHN